MKTGVLRKLHKDSQGFTLIELMIVVAIIGILAAIAVPQFMAYRTRATNASSKSIIKLTANTEANLNSELGAYGNIDPVGTNNLTAVSGAGAFGASGPADSATIPALAADASATIAGGRLEGTNGKTGADLSVPLGIGASMTLETVVPAAVASTNSSTAWVAQARHLNGDTIYAMDSELPNTLFRVSNPAWPRTAGMGTGSVTLPAKTTGTIFLAGADGDPNTAADNFAGGGSPTATFTVVE